MLELIVVVLLDILLVKSKLKVNSEIITIYFFIYFSVKLVFGYCLDNLIVLYFIYKILL